MSETTKKEIRLEVLHNGEWSLYYYLIDGANKLGHYGSAKDAWIDAEYLVKRFPESYRIVEQKV